MICAPDGGVIDDLIVYRLAEERFLVVANAGNAQRRLRRARGAARRLRGRSSTTGRWRRRSSRSRARARSRSSAPLTDVDLARAPLLRASPRARSPGIPALVARTGYTGEDGFEIFVEIAGPRTPVGRPARRPGGPHGLVPVGLGARDTLRLEAGMPLYGNELDRDHEPVRRRARARRQARQAAATSSAGRRSRRSPREGPAKRLVGLVVRGPRHRPPRLSGPRRRAGRTGVVTSGDPVADARHADRDGVRRSGRCRTGYDARRRDPRRSASPPRSSAAVLPATGLG